MWVDVSSPDMDKTRDFYGTLFGWQSQITPEPEAGGYTVFQLDGKMVAGAGPTFSPDQHPAWSTYVCTADVEETARAAKEAGGKVLVEPMDVMGQGRMAVLADPTGALISLWQPQAHRGAELVNEPGSFSWNELYTRDLPAAREFYGKVFGWDWEETQMDVGPYTVFKVDGRPIAGGLDMTNLLPDTVPPHWLVYFTVKDTNGTIDRVKELGGQCLAGPMPTPMGPMAVLDDPVTAAFAVIQLSSES